MPAQPPPDWWDTAVIYEIYPRSFQDSNGDGIGDLPGIISRLDYLNDGTPGSLGVDGIWLTPIYPSPLCDFGYDISNYVDIDPMYGTLADFERLTREAHARGIKVIMDLVANHTSYLHPWFQQSRSSRDNPKRDWYVWHDPAPDGAPPNNWLSVFGGSAWTYDEARGQYYLHSFLAEQPDLNWTNPEVREAIFEVVRFWMGKGVDGFRLDAIAHIAKDPEFRDNPPAGGRARRRPFESDYDMQEHLYDKNWPTIHPWLQDLRAVVDKFGGGMLVSEIYGLKPEDVRSYHGGAGRPEMHLSFNFDLLESAFSASAVRAAVEGFEADLPSGAWPNVVLNNHDQPRFISRHNADGHGEERGRLAAMLMLTLRGSVFLYYGEEIGMRDGVIPREDLHDPLGIRSWPDRSGRDPERTPMQWTPEPKAGFTTGKPWLPIGTDQEQLNVAAESHDPRSMLSLYRHLVWLRKRTPALLYGSYRSIDGVPDSIYCYRREAGDESLLIALNFGDQHVPLPGDLAGSSPEVVASTHSARQGTTPASISLLPFEGLILRPAK